jgi:heat shock protein HtpX
MSHIGNKDILLATVVIVLVGFVSILSDMMLRISFFRSRGDRNSGSGLIVILSLILAILAPLASSLIQLAISRKREYLADAGAALLTRYPEGLASALEKLRDHGKPMQAKSTAIAHLYISDPKGEIRNRKIKNIFATHPPIEDRIKRLRGVL